MKRIAGVVSIAAVLSAAPVLCRSASACPGDCDGDGRVAIDELLRSVRMALGTTPIECAGLDADGDGAVTIDELLRAVAASLSGCPATPSATPTMTPTPSVNLAPVFPTPRLYRAFPGFEISSPVGAIDPNGDPLHCVAQSLPEGAILDDAILDWTPSESQVGAFEIPITCSDDRDPPLAADGVLHFLVSPLDACMIPQCDPALGCDVELPPPDVPCCQGETHGLDLPVSDCPVGAAVSIGAVGAGFAPLRDCDHFRVKNFAQTGAQVEFKIAARCVNTLNPVSVTIRIDAGAPCPRPTPQRCRRPMVNFFQPRAFLTKRPDGSTVPIPLSAAEVVGGTPFFDLQGTEANLVVTITDSDNLVVTRAVRVLLTFTPIPTVPAPSPTPTPSAATGD